MTMGYEENNITERLLKLTLKILHLLFEEDYIIMKISGGQFRVSSHSPWSRGWRKTQSSNMETASHFTAPEVLKVTNKIIELLTGEVPIRCQDVTVYFSMEEWEYIEGHKDLYQHTMMEDQQLASSSDPKNMDSTCHSPVTSKYGMEEDYDIDITATNYYLAEEQMVNKISTVYEKEQEIRQLEKHTTTNSVFGNNKKSASRMDKMSSVHEDHTYALTFEKAKAIMQRLGLWNQPDDYLDSASPDTQCSAGDKKEDIVLHQEEHLQQSDISGYVDSAEYMTVCIKEEPNINTLEHLPKDGSSAVEGYYQDTSTIKKEEPIPCQEFPSSTSTSAPQQYNFVHIKEEPVSGGEEVPAEIELFVDGTHCPSDHPKKPSKSKHSSKECPFSCTVCGKLFKNKSGLGRHIKIHVKGQWYTCHVCGKCFPSFKKLRTHQKLHIDETPYSCHECGKHFSKETNLTNHQRIHATKNPFSCAKCGKHFVSNANLRRHQKKHEGEVENTEIASSECGEGSRDKQEQHLASEELYSCGECGRRFIKRINLVKHQRFHTRKNLHYCQECGKYFMSRGYLLKHMKCHSKKRRPCSCPLCGKNFHSKLDLTIHQRIHKGEKPSTDSEWRKSFIRKLGFVMQERSNAGEKPYLCSDCGERFEKKLELLRHEKTHNDVKPDLASLAQGIKLEEQSEIS